MSIVKRLLSGPSNVDCLAAADLIEQQAERIKGLEAKRDYWRDHYKDLRKRIADVEAENARNKRIYKAMIAAAPKPVVPAWQPIETAPRDGTDVLIYTMAGSMYVAAYDDAFSNVWRIRNDEGVNARVVTHWMPLPAAPENGHD